MHRVHFVQVLVDGQMNPLLLLLQENAEIAVAVERDCYHYQSLKKQRQKNKRQTNLQLYKDLLQLLNQVHHYQPPILNTLVAGFLWKKEEFLSRSIFVWQAITQAMIQRVGG